MGTFALGPLYEQLCNFVVGGKRLREGVYIADAMRGQCERVRQCGGSWRRQRRALVVELVSKEERAASGLLPCAACVRAHRELVTIKYGRRAGPLGAPGTRKDKDQRAL